MDKINQKFSKDMLDLRGIYKNKQENFDEMVTSEDFLDSIPDDYLYNYYADAERFDKYFSPEQYIFCTLNSSLRIGSIYFNEARVRCAHQYLATYMLLEREWINLYAKDKEQVLRPININPTVEDKDNLIAVFNQYMYEINPKDYHQEVVWGEWKKKNKRFKTFNTVDVAFNKQINEGNYENALYILLCLIGLLSFEENGVREEVFHKFESHLGDNGNVYMYSTTHHSRGLALNLKFDMSHFHDFLSQLVMGIEFCSLGKAKIDVEEFNRIADAFVDSVTPDFLKRQNLYNKQDEFNFDTCLIEMGNFL